MNKSEIILCQGNKTELEAITGREYEYINFCPKELLAKDPEINSDVYKNKIIGHTFISGTNDNGNEEYARIDLYNEAYKVKADAIINYTYLLEVLRDGSFYGIARGTPLRLKK